MTAKRITSRTHLVDRPTLAKVLGVSERTCKRLEAAGVVTPTAKPRRGRTTRYDLTVVVPAVIAHRSKPPAEPGTLDATQERAALARSQRLLAEQRLARERRDLLPRGDVADGWAELADAHRETLLQLAADLVAAGAITTEQERAVDDVCRARLTAYTERVHAR
jgi:phage terminase Nu1 subunit (DNA packaging protein)